MLPGYCPLLISTAQKDGENGVDESMASRPQEERMSCAENYSQWNTAVSDGFWSLPNSGRFERTQEEIRSHADRPTWRYMSLPKFVSLLDTKSLRFTRLDQFNDMHEGAFSRPVYDYFVETNRARFAHRLGDRAADYAAERTALSFAVGIKAAREQVLANCWHGSDVESAAMWAGYGVDGVAIRSTLGRLANILYAEGLEVQPVYYIDFDTDQMDYSCSYLFKHKLYQAEREVRALWLMPGSKCAPPSAHIEVNLSELVTGVCLSPDAGELQKRVVESLLKMYGLSSMPVKASAITEVPPYRRRIEELMERLKSMPQETMIATMKEEWETIINSSSPGIEAISPFETGDS